MRSPWQKFYTWFRSGGFVEVECSEGSSISVADINPIRPRVCDALGSLGGGADSAPPNLLLFWTT